MKIRYTAFIFLILFCCCHKSNNNKPVAFSFSTTYDSVITTYANTSFLYSVSLNVLTGSITGNQVTYSVSGLPTGVTDSPASFITSNLLGGGFNFKVGNVAPGSYQLDLESNCTATGIKHHNVILKILPLPDYSTTLAGTYPGSHNYCQPADTLYSFLSVVDTISGTPYTITISNVKVYDTTLMITALLSGGITIPLQRIGSYTTWGAGTYTHDNAPYNILYALAIYDTIVNGLDTQTCLIHIQH